MTSTFKDWRLGNVHPIIDVIGRPNISLCDIGRCSRNCYEQFRHRSRENIQDVREIQPETGMVENDLRFSVYQVIQRYKVGKENVCPARSQKYPYIKNFFTMEQPNFLNLRSPETKSTAEKYSSYYQDLLKFELKLFNNDDEFGDWQRFSCVCRW